MSCPKPNVCCADGADQQAQRVAVAAAHVERHRARTRRRGERAAEEDRAACPAASAPSRDPRRSRPDATRPPRGSRPAARGRARRPSRRRRGRSSGRRSGCRCVHLRNSVPVPTVKSGRRSSRASSSAPGGYRPRPRPRSRSRSPAASRAGGRGRRRAHPPRALRGSRAGDRERERRNRRATRNILLPVMGVPPFMGYARNSPPGRSVAR